MTCLDRVQPTHGLAFIRRITTEETYRGGRIVVPDASRDKLAALQFTIVALGPWERCDDADCDRPHTDGRHGTSLAVGDWVVVRKRAWLASPDPDLYIVRTGDILGVFEEGV